MINIKRTNKKSHFTLYTKKEFMENAIVPQNAIQIAMDEDFVIIEWLDVEDMQELEENITPFDAQPQKTQAQMDLETALDTMLINDPLGKYNNCNLRVPFDRKDNEWIEWVLKNMHNKFIRDKVQLIKDSGYEKA